MQELLKSILIFLISVVTLAIFAFLCAAVIRRVLRGRMFAELDRNREFYRESLRKDLSEETALQRTEFYRAGPGSVKWRAVEENLLDFIREEGYRDQARKLFTHLGHVSHYEEMLKSRSAITRASAIDKLGRMMSEESVEKLASILHGEDPELASVAVRSLGKIGTEEALSAILKRLPALFRRSLVTRRTAESALLQFGRNGIPRLIESGWEQDHPQVKSTILEILSRLGSGAAVPLAVHNLQNVSPEVRARALKVIGGAAQEITDFEGEMLFPLLADSVWFVRLNAAKALGSLRHEAAAPLLGNLLFDENWHVRSGAAGALASLGDRGISIFRDTLRQDDRYAKECVCEELERTGMVGRLIEHLNSEEPETRETSREILATMISLNFRTKCDEYLKEGEREDLRKTLKEIFASAKEP